METERYIIKGSAQGRERPRLLSDVFGPSTRVVTCLTIETIAAALLGDDLTTRQQRRKSIEGLREFADNPEIVLGGPRVFQAWGRSLR